MYVPRVLSDWYILINQQTLLRAHCVFSAVFLGMYSLNHSSTFSTRVQKGCFSDFPLEDTIPLLWLLCKYPKARWFGKIPCLFSKYSEAHGFRKFLCLFSKYCEAHWFRKFPRLFGAYSEVCWFRTFPLLFGKYSEAHGFGKFPYSFGKYPNAHWLGKYRWPRSHLNGLIATSSSKNIVFFDVVNEIHLSYP